MDPTRWDQLQDLFHQALALAPEARADFLERECGDDTVLRLEIAALLGTGRPGQPSLGDAVEEVAHDFVRGGDPEVAGAEIGPYRVIRHLASGGMGEVYLAEQQIPVRRQVALKTIKRGMDTAQILRRFESERHALARMNHPNIARVLDAGSTPDGRPYFVMEYVAGAPITTFCDRRRLTTDERLRLLLDVCAGVQHAHQQGILHRDIKPSNVLVEEIDRRSVPKIIDFGIAKALGDEGTPATMVTEVGQIIGTPAYMSPEQVGSGDTRLDTRSDVYSLGVLLYELLVGAPPLDTASSGGVADDTLRRRIREEEPQRPSARVTSATELAGTVAAARRTTTAALSRTLRGELDWIALKALEKEPERRYRTPADLQADIERYFANEPVEAGPPSRLYRVRKFARRHRAAAIAGSLVIVALMAGVVGTSIGLVRARRAEARAQSEAREANAVAAFMKNLILELDPSRLKGRPPAVRDILSRATTRMRAELQDQPHVRAKLLGAIGDVFRGIGAYDSARSLSAEEIALIERLGVANGVEMAEAQERLGNLLRDVGATDSARLAIRRELSIRESLPQPNDYAMANGIRTLATVELVSGRFTAAESLLQRELTLRQRIVPRDEMLIATTLGNLGIAYMEMGDYARARGPLERTAAVYRALPGPPSMELGRTYHNLGTLMLSVGEADSAEVMFTRCLAIFEPVLGPNHTVLANTYESLASTKLAQKDPKSAERWGLRAREIFVRISSSSAGDVGVVDGILGQAYRQQHRYPEALAAFERSVAVQQSAFGENDARLGDTLYWYAGCLAETGNRTAGRLQAARAVDILSATLPAEHPDLVKAQKLVQDLGPAH